MNASYSYITNNYATTASITQFITASALIPYALTATLSNYETVNNFNASYSTILNSLPIARLGLTSSGITFSVDQTYSNNFTATQSMVALSIGTASFFSSLNAFNIMATGSFIPENINIIVGNATGTSSISATGGSVNYFTGNGSNVIGVTSSIAGNGGNNDTFGRIGG